jgi:hypothetical protein
MADIFTNADERQKAQQVALMKAIAEAGQAGQAAFQQQQQALQAQRADAIARALQAASAINAPQGLNAQLAQTVARPSDIQAADLSAAQRLFQQAQEARTAANQNYMTQLRAAIPLVQARTQATVERLKQEAAQREQDRAMERELRQMQAELERAKIEVERQRLAQGKPLSVAERKYLDQQQKKAAQAYVLKKMRENASPDTVALFNDVVSTAKNPQDAYASLNRYYRQVGPDVYEIDPKTGEATGVVFKKVSLAKTQDWLRRYYETSAPPKPKPKYRSPVSGQYENYPIRAYYEKQYGGKR